MWHCGTSCDIEILVTLSHMWYCGITCDIVAHVTLWLMWHCGITCDIVAHVILWHLWHWVTCDNVAPHVKFRHMYHCGTCDNEAHVTLRHMWYCGITCDIVAPHVTLWHHMWLICLFITGILFLLMQTAFLIVTFVLMRDIESHVAHMIDWFIDKGVFLPTIATPTLNTNDSLSENFVSYRSYLIKVSNIHIQYTFYTVTMGVFIYSIISSKGRNLSALVG